MAEGPETQMSEVLCKRLLLTNAVWLDADIFQEGPGSSLTMSSYLGRHSPKREERRRLCVFFLAMVR